MTANISNKLLNLQSVQHRRTTAYSILLFFFTITLAFIIIIIADYRNFENRFNSDAARINTHFDYYIKQNETVLEGFSAFIAGLGGVNDQVLNRFAAQLVARFPHIHMLEIAEAVKDSDVSKYIKQMKRKGLTDFDVKAFDYSGYRVWRKLSISDIRFPLIYLYPLADESRKVLGLDMNSHQHLSIPLNRAVDSGNYEISSPFNLIEGDKAYVIFKSVNLPDTAMNKQLMSLLVITAESLSLDTISNDNSLGILLYHNSIHPADPAGHLFNKKIDIGNLLPVISFESSIAQNKKGYVLQVIKQFQIDDVRWYLYVITFVILSLLFYQARKILCQNMLMQKNTFNELQSISKAKAISNLTGGIAHEFNNNLSVVRGFLSLLSTAEDKDSVKWIKYASDASEKCIELTKSLLIYSRYKGVSERICGVNINECINELNSKLLDYINKEITLKFELEEMSSIISLSYADLQEILIQLLKNSNDSINGDGEIFISTAKVLLKGTEDVEIGRDVIPGEYVLLSISDSGCGIDDDIRAHVFDPFFTTKEIGKGAGMGLSIVYGLVKINNGYINFTSDNHKGTKFNIYIPLLDS